MSVTLSVLCCSLGFAEQPEVLQDALDKYIHSLDVKSNVTTSGNPTPACHVCDLATVHVPQELGWLEESDPSFINELYDVNDPNLVWSYWDRVERASRKEKSLHEACQFSRHIPSNAARIVARKKRGEGVLIAIRGDSHSRATFQAMARSMTRNALSFLELNLNSSVAHSDHLFCCAQAAAPSPLSSSLSVGYHEGIFVHDSFTRCTLENAAPIDLKTMKFSNSEGLHGTLVGTGDFSDLRVRAKEHVVGKGEVCVAWENRDRWRDDVDKFGGNSLQKWADVGLAPDLFLANGGPHYGAPELVPAVFGPEFGAWLEAAASALEGSPTLLAATTLVVMSSPANG